MFWGIMLRPIDWSFLFVPFLYFIAVCLAAILLTPVRFFVHDKKDASLLQITGLVSNTGNLGIPLALFLFGPESVPYTAMINLANGIFILTFGAYRYSRGKFSIKKSLLNVLKLPTIWSAFLAICWQLLEWDFPSILMKPLEMAAYSTMVIQLMIFGMFIATLHRKSMDLKHISFIQITKFVLVPLTVLLLAKQVTLPVLALHCLFIQSIMPIAVNNMNLSALYDCHPQKVAMQAIISTIIVFLLLPFLLSNKILSLISLF